MDRLWKEMVGATGLEPAAPCTPCKCATRLRYAPTQGKHITRPDFRCHANSAFTKMLSPYSSEVVFDPLDVVLAEVLSPLHLYYNQGLPADILNPVQHPRGDIR